MHATSYRRCVKTNDFLGSHILRAVSVLQWAPKKNHDFDNFAYTPHLEGKKSYNPQIYKIAHLQRLMQKVI